MKVSTKGRYALRIMIDLAQQGRKDYIPLKDISERQGISMKYLEMIIGLLNRAGFVMSHRGKAGGYMLSAPAANYTVASILRVAEGSLAPVECLETKDNTCPRAESCITLPMWQGLSKVIDDYLESITIEDMIVNQKNMMGNDYHI